MGFSLAVVHVSWNGRYLSGLLMNRRGGGKIRTAIAYPFLMGRGSGMRALHGATPPSSEGSELLALCQPPADAASGGSVVSLFSFVQELTDTSSKTLCAFFFCSFLPQPHEAASQGA